VRDTGGHIRAAVSVVGRQQDLLSRERTMRTALAPATAAALEESSDADTDRTDRWRASSVALPPMTACAHPGRAHSKQRAPEQRSPKGSP
jgi:hypothetical protein